MKKFENILIASDLDGTFLSDSGVVVKENIDALQYFIQNGGRFTFATGRGLDALAEIVPCLYSIANAPLILCNGAFIYDHKERKILCEESLDADFFIDAAARIHRTFPQLSFYVYYRPRETAGDYCVLHRDEKNTENLDFYRDKVIFKAVFASDEQTILAAQEYAVPLFSSRAFFCRSCPFLFEMLPVNGTKGRKLKQLSSLLGENISTFGIGDFHNDYDLLLSSAHPACPQNGVQQLKDIAEIITRTNNDGAISHLINIIENKYISGGKK